MVIGVSRPGAMMAIIAGPFGGRNGQHATTTPSKKQTSYDTTLDEVS